MSGERCEYNERNRRCPGHARWVIKIDGRESGMCDRHIKPEFYPRDLRKSLPNRIRRLIGGAS